jgi:transcriptional regulator with XRE-family HTH domain
MVAEAKTTNRIREVRLARGLSQSALGKLVDMSEPAINRYERGGRKPTREKMHQIAKALGVPLQALFVDLSARDGEVIEEVSVGELTGGDLH